MAWLIVLDGGSISVESDDPVALISEIEGNPAYIELSKAVESEGLYFSASPSSEDGDDECAVFMLGKELLPERYLCQGQISSIGQKFCESNRAKVDHFLDELDALLDGSGHATVRVSGIVINHFD